MRWRIGIGGRSDLTRIIIEDWIAAQDAGEKDTKEAKKK